MIAPIMIRIVLLFIAVGVSFCGASPSKSKSRSVSASESSSTERNAYPVLEYQSGIYEKKSEETVNRRGSWSLSSDKVSNVADIVAENAIRYNISEDLIFGIIWVESRFDPRAVSPVGARGLMQLMPQTAKYLAECIKWDGRANSYDPNFNIAAGTYYISRLIKEFGGNENLALAAYNAGPTKVKRWLAAEGLPKISVEYASMVQTARGFFMRQSDPASSSPLLVATKNTENISEETVNPTVIISDDELDRLGLTILIAGLGNSEFQNQREDIENPFD